MNGSANRISPEGRARLRLAIAARRPWLRSTGPRSAEGKARSRHNAAKHGYYTAEAIALRRQLADLRRIAD